VAELALVVEQERREAAERALALATAALATALKRREAAERTSALAILMLANVQKRQQAAERAQMSANSVMRCIVDIWATRRLSAFGWSLLCALLLSMPFWLR
jgi:hypothetical protein